MHIFVLHKPHCVPWIAFGEELHFKFFYQCIRIQKQTIITNSILKVVSLNCCLQPNLNISAPNQVCNSLAEFSLPSWQPLTEAWLYWFALSCLAAIAHKQATTSPQHSQTHTYKQRHTSINTNTCTGANMRSFFLHLTHTHTQPRTLFNNAYIHSHANICSHSHTTACTHANTHTDRCILSFAILRLSTGSGLTVAVSSQWRTEQDTAGRWLNANHWANTGRASVIVHSWLSVRMWVFWKHVAGRQSHALHGCLLVGAWNINTELSGSEHNKMYLRVLRCVCLRPVPGWWCSCRLATCWCYVAVRWRGYAGPHL